ncbi:M14 family zinc carboxypeptidase, partial [Hwangdonia sp.]|uniref:M14 family zinc carboxypeptidase n=1 Tax=Hwangdonia sp. TaxID=1883432 RepID=UPI003AB574C3
MKKTTLIIVLFTLIAQLTFSQNISKLKAEKYLKERGELVFTFTANNLNEVKQLANIVSFDHGQNPKTPLTIKAIANEDEFNHFLNFNLSYTIGDSDNEPKERLMSNQIKKSSKTGKAFATPLTFPLTAYPTYQDYADQMALFASNNPSICELVDIGGTTEGVGGGDKRLLFIKLSDNVTTDEQEPKMMYTSSMHGDEIAGYPLMLDLINYFITVYNDIGHSDHSRVKNLIDNSEIWINPLANPDGTYYNNPSNTSVANARRANDNGFDLNRNYPDNLAGPHSNGHTAYELETQHFMNFADAHHFVLSANFHGGVEVVNYPWDNTYDRHADDAWFQLISREYADNAQADSNGVDNGYMDDLTNGITHGADWYRVDGGRQDYMNFYHQCKETTIELSNDKTPLASELNNLWNFNKEALIEYLIQGTYGFRGVVKDANTNSPIEATITLVGHDAVGSHTVSEANIGDYYRPVKAGTYDILFEADCYQSFTLTNQTITDYETKILSDVLLTPIAVSPPSNLTSSNISSTTATLTWDSTISGSYDYRYRVVGSPTWTTTNTTNLTEIISGLAPTTQYEAQIRSTCSGTNSSSYSSSTLFTTTALPPCTGPQVSSFPYSENWDNGIGDWSQGTNDIPGTNYEDWTLNSGTTGSSGTGPNDDFTGSQEYFYTEASNTNTTTNVGQNVSVTLISPCFDLTGHENAIFSFYYHMFGSGMGSLELEVSIDNGSNWINLATISGQQQGSNGAAWLQHTESLSAYDGQVIKLRFVGNTGSTYQSDMAIDEIGLTANTVSLTTWYQDADSDTFGNPSVSQVAASQPAGYVADNTDCDDNNANINPNTVWYLGVDNDSDGFFGSQITATQCTSPGAGYSTDAPTVDDCDDNDANINPNTV